MMKACAELRTSNQSFKEKSKRLEDSHIKIEELLNHTTNELKEKKGGYRISS